MTHDLSGRIVLVTGGSKGLGRSICQAFGDTKATVIVNYAHSVEGAKQTVQMIEQAGGKAVAIQADITDEASVERLIGEIKEQTGDSVDILVNNATGPQPELSIEESSWQDYLDQLNFFVKAPLLLLKAVLPGMKQRGYGRIVNIGSEVIQVGNANFANYVTAKSAQLGMTRSWANELGPSGITVNLLNPGFIPVERHEGVDPEGYRIHVPLRKMGEPIDIANAAVFLASDEARFITGQSLSVNGGNTFGI